MNGNIKAFLNEKGYTVNEVAFDVIRKCNAWYQNSVIKGFHTRVGLNGQSYTVDSLNFAKRCCSDDANLCEVVEISVDGANKKANNLVNEVLNKSNFNTMYRRQLEQVPALGTVGGYISLEGAELKSNGRIKNGRISINYVDAEGIFPLTVVNNEILEVAFADEHLVNGNTEYTVVVFTMDDNGRYIASTYYLDDKGKEITNLTTIITLGDVKPFGIMRNAEVNNLENMTGYGLPKIYNAIPMLKVVDLAFYILFSDLDKGEKILLINELLCQFDKDGKPCLTPEQKKLFVMMGEKLPEQNNLIHEYNPEIRIDEVTKALETALSLLSIMFGYGSKKYTFENGKITTATEYIGTKQDQMQELNRQRYEARCYIEDITNAIIWFANTFNDANLPVKYEVLIDFDDSFITDKEAQLERVRADALSFDIPMLTIWYLMDAYNLSEEEAKALIESKSEEPEETED